MNGDDFEEDYGVDVLEEEFDDEMEQLLDEFGEDDDVTERRRRRRRGRRAPVAPGGRSFRPRLAQTYVTQAQLQATAARLDRKIATNAKGIQQLNARANTLSAQQDRQAAALRKEISERKKEDAKLRNNLQMMALLPLLMRKSLDATTTADTVGGAPVPQGTKLAVEPSDNLSLLLPLVLTGGLGGSGSEGGTDSNMLLLAVALSGGL